MKNIEVIQNFLNGRNAKTKHLSTNGIELINYNTTIAFKTFDKLYIDANKYSKATSTIQNALKQEAENYYTTDNIITYTTTIKL